MPPDDRVTAVPLQFLSVFQEQQETNKSQGLVLFKDVSVNFTQVERQWLDLAQKILYRVVMLRKPGFSGFSRTKPNVISSLEQGEEPCITEFSIQSLPALFTVATTWKQLEHPSVDECRDSLVEEDAGKSGEAKTYKTNNLGNLN